MRTHAAGTFAMNCGFHGIPCVGYNGLDTQEILHPPTTVDIGDLDMILLRNVPPLTANYWQRVGRAGRRHRMAVLYTYCRNSNHDNYFFDDPYHLLRAPVQPPRFNLKNRVAI